MNEFARALLTVDMEKPLNLLVFGSIYKIPLFELSTKLTSKTLPSFFCQIQKDHLEYLMNLFEYYLKIQCTELDPNYFDYFSSYLPFQTPIRFILN